MITAAVTAALILSAFVPTLRKGKLRWMSICDNMDLLIIEMAATTLQLLILMLLLTVMAGIPLLNKHKKAIYLVCTILCCFITNVAVLYNGNSLIARTGGVKWKKQMLETRPQLREALDQLKEAGVSAFGLHAFLSSNTREESYFPELAELLLRLGMELSGETGLRFAFIDLSGGVGIPYRPEDPAPDIRRIGEGVREAFGRACPEGGVGIKTELGRWMTGPCGWLVTRAVHEKKIYRDYIGTDACAVNLMRPAMYGAYHHITVCGKRDWPEDHVYDITGSLCENNDKFAVERKMPEIRIGDLLVIHDTGAHGYAMGYNYNGRLRSAEILYTAEGGYRMIRRAERPEDYFATLDVDEAFS